MGLDMFLYAIEEIKNLRMATPSEQEKDYYEKEVTITFADGREKTIKAWYISDLFLKNGKQVDVWHFNNVSPKGNIQYEEWDEKTQEPVTNTVNVTDIKDIKYQYAYWRKANQIHKWFVDTVQEGNDNCGDYNMTGYILQHLVDLCKEVLDKRDTEFSKENLPSQCGFFFGSTDYDEYYYKDLENTIEQLKNVKPTQVYTYSSSW